MIVIGFIYSNLFNQVLLEMKPILRAVVLVLVLPAWHGMASGTDECLENSELLLLLGSRTLERAKK